LSDAPETCAQTVILYYEESHDHQPTATSGFLSLQGGINFRDLGGQRTADGRRGTQRQAAALRRAKPDDG
jgi:hypothetical protein